MQWPRLWLTQRAAMVLRILVVLFLILIFASNYFTEARRPKARQERSMLLSEVANRGGVQVFVVTEGGACFDSAWPIHAEVPPVDGWCSYLPLLKTELEIYSESMLKRCALKSVVLCTGLRCEGRVAGGLADYVTGRIYLDVTGRWNGTTYARRTVHHEIFHLIDYKDGGRLHQDPAWAGVNREDFRYGNGGRSQTDPEALLPDESIEGFLNKYSQSAMEEDKAEIYSHMMACKDILAERMRKDRIIKHKYTEIIKRLSNFFPDKALEYWLNVPMRPAI